MRIPLLGLIILALAPSPSAGQQRFDLASRRAIPLPGSASGPLGRTARGDFTADRHQDVLLLRGSTLLLAYGPGNFSFVAEHPLAANDVLSLAGTNPDGSDSFLLVNDSGLVHSWFQHRTGFQSAVLQNGVGWEGAQRVLATSPATAAEVDVVVLSSSGTDLLFLSDVLGVRSLVSVVPLVSPVLDMVALDWTSKTSLEVGVVCQDAVYVLDAAGRVLLSASVSTVTGHIIGFRQNGLATERAAVVTTKPGPGNAGLTVLDRSTVEPAVVLSSAEVVGVTAGDIDQDGDDDLVLHHKDGFTMPVGINTSDGNPPTGQPTFDFDPAEIIDLGYGPGAAILQSGAASLCDLDADGDLDLLAPIGEFDELVFLRNATIDDGPQRVSILSAVYQHDYAAGVGNLNLEVQLPVPRLSGATHLQTVVWRRDDLSQPVSTAAVVNRLSRFPIIGPLQLTLSLPEPGIYTTSAYYVQLREVQAAPLGPIVAGGVTETRAFSTATLTDQQLKAMASGPGTPVTLVRDPAEPWFRDDSELSSAMHPFFDPGDFESEAPPDPTTPTS